jgi:hypothetical protein
VVKSFGYQHNTMNRPRTTATMNPGTPDLHSAHCEKLPTHTTPITTAAPVSPHFAVLAILRRFILPVYRRSRTPSPHAADGLREWGLGSNPAAGRHAPARHSPGRKAWLTGVVIDLGVHWHFRRATALGARGKRRQPAARVAALAVVGARALSTPTQANGGQRQRWDFDHPERNVDTPEPVAIIIPMRPPRPFLRPHSLREPAAGTAIGRWELVPGQIAISEIQPAFTVPPVQPEAPGPTGRPRDADENRNHEPAPSGIQPAAAGRCSHARSLPPPVRRDPHHQRPPAPPAALPVRPRVAAQPPVGHHRHHPPLSGPAPAQHAPAGRQPPRAGLQAPKPVAQRTYAPTTGGTLDSAHPPTISPDVPRLISKIVVIAPRPLGASHPSR